MFLEWLWRLSQMEAVLGMGSGVDYDMLMLANAKQYYAFLQALAKMPTKKEGIAPVLQCGLLRQGLTCPRKGKNMQISNQSMPSCSWQSDLLKWNHVSYLQSSLGNALVRPLLPWLLRAREKGESPVSVCSTSLSYFYRKNYVFSISLEADREALGIKESSSDSWKSITISWLKGSLRHRPIEKLCLLHFYMQLHHCARAGYVGYNIEPGIWNACWGHCSWGSALQI